MTEDPNTPPPSDARPTRAEWLARLAEIGRVHGFFERLGPRHSGLFVQEGDTLLVTFDQAERVFRKAPDGLPLGFSAVQRWEWSLLNIMAGKQTWFRDQALYDFFDRLVDEDFFESFDRVIFLGCGPMCGYAACAYSVTSPGAQVLAVNPAATLDREDAPFELRFRGARRLNFRDRYGYAPHMLEGAADAHVVFDPYEPLGAAHAALYRGPNITRHPIRWAGLGAPAILESDGALLRVLRALANDKLTPRRFSQITRASRRNFAPYVQTVVNRALQKGHDRLALMAARHGAAATSDPRFARQVTTLEAQLPPETAGAA